MGSEGPAGVEGTAGREVGRVADGGGKKRIGGLEGLGNRLRSFGRTGEVYRAGEGYRTGGADRTGLLVRKDIGGSVGGLGLWNEGNWGRAVGLRGARPFIDCCSSGSPGSIFSSNSEDLGDRDRS